MTDDKLFAQFMCIMWRKYTRSNSLKFFVWTLDVQQKVISMTKPITEEAISKLYSSITPRSLAIADLGCSSGPNTFFVASELIEVVDKLRRNLGHQSPEYQVFLQFSSPCQAS